MTEKYDTDDEGETLTEEKTITTPRSFDFLSENQKKN